MQAAGCQLEREVDGRTFAAGDLADLEAGVILAIRWKNFCSEEMCAIIEQRIGLHEGKTRYSVAPSIEKIGVALFETVDSASELQRYYEDARIAPVRATEIYDGFVDPIDRLRAILDSLWPAGCTVENLHGREMYAGLIRIIAENCELRPHQDNTNWDAPDSERAQSMRTQFSCNIYFSCPQLGGELLLWDRGIRESDEYRRIRVPADYGLDPSAIGPPTLRLRPAPGELIIFDARRIHSVSRVLQGARTNTSSFIALRGESEPLTLFS
jgi:hypothetical protein